MSKIKYLLITTRNPEEFLTEMDKVCQKYAIDRVQGTVVEKEYWYNWDNEKAG